MTLLSTRTIHERYKIPLSVIRDIVRSGLVTPSRGARREYAFNFQDIVILRMAHELRASRLSPRKIARFLRHVRDELPASERTALRLLVVGDELVIRQGDAARTAAGQLLLDLAPDSVVERARPVGQVRSRKRPADELLKEDWFDRAIQLEAIDPGGAEAAYRAAIAANPADSRPYQNLGLLLSKMKRTAEAHALSEKAAKTFPDKAELQFNLGVSCETLGRDEDAVRAYTAALECDPGFADAHYNLALVHERLGHKKEVIRHLNAYRRLVR